MEEDGWVHTQHTSTTSSEGKSSIYTQCTHLQPAHRVTPLHSDCSFRLYVFAARIYYLASKVAKELFYPICLGIEEPTHNDDNCKGRGTAKHVQVFKANHRESDALHMYSATDSYWMLLKVIWIHSKHSSSHSNNCLSGHRLRNSKLLAIQAVQLGTQEEPLD